MKKIISMTTALAIIIILIIFISCKIRSNKSSDEDVVNLGNVTINLEEYNLIEIGISYNELTNIVGGECNKTKEESTNNKEIVYTCSGIKAGTSATFTFKDSKLINKTQVGL